MKLVRSIQTGEAMYEGWWPWGLVRWCPCHRTTTVAPVPLSMLLRMWWLFADWCVMFGRRSTDKEVMEGLRQSVAELHAECLKERRESEAYRDDAEKWRELKKKAEAWGAI